MRNGRPRHIGMVMYVWANAGTAMVAAPTNNKHAAIYSTEEFPMLLSYFALQ